MRPDLGPKPLLGYTASILRARRRATRRQSVPRRLRGQRALRVAFAIGGELVVMRKTANGPDPLFRAEEVRALAPSAETVFLGLAGEAGRFGIALDPEATKGLKGRPDLLVTDLRSIAVQGLVGPEHLAPLAEAKALLAWHARHRFCANCGQPTAMSQAGWKRECPACKVEHFPRTDPVVIMLAVDGERCLLGRAGRFVQNMWSCLAGFIEPGESMEEAVRRETLEEAGIVCGEVKYFASQPWPFPMSLMIGCHAQATSQRDHGRPRGAGGRALVHPRRGRADVQGRASGGDQHPAADRDRAPHHPRLGRRGRRCLRLTCAQACVVRRHRGARHAVPRRGVSASGSEDPGERIPHRRWRQRGECRGRDRASRRARELLRPARRPADGRAGDTFLKLAAREDIDCSACPRVADVPSPVSAICIDAPRRARDRELPRRAPRRRARPKNPAALVAGVDAVIADNRFPGYVRDMCAAARARHPGRARRRRAAPRQQHAVDGRDSHVVFSAEGLRATAGTDQSRTRH